MDFLKKLWSSLKDGLKAFGLYFASRDKQMYLGALITLILAALIPNNVIVFFGAVVLSLVIGFIPAFRKKESYINAWYDAFPSLVAVFFAYAFAMTFML